MKRIAILETNMLVSVLGNISLIKFLLASGDNFSSCLQGGSVVVLRSGALVEDETAGTGARRLQASRCFIPGDGSGVTTGGCRWGWCSISGAGG